VLENFELSIYLVRQEKKMLKAYREHAAERAALGIPPLPLDAKQTAELIELIKSPPQGEDAFLLDLLTHRVPPGVDDAAKVKASFLSAVAHGDLNVALISKAKATELLGTMVGGYNVKPLIDLLDDKEVGAVAAEGLKKTLLMFDFFHDVAEKSKAGNANASAVIKSWADAEWFTSRPEVEKKITVTVFKVPGETNTDDLSPAPDAWSRPDIPLHYLAMLKNTRPDAAFKPEEDGKRGPMAFIEELKKKGHLVAYVGDVVGTGSSRKSATNSIIWGFGEDIPFVPNKRFGGVTLGGKIAPSFFNTQEDSGALPIEVDVSKLEMGDVIDVLPYEGKIMKNGALLNEFELRSEMLFDEVRAGGRINLIIGRYFTGKAREFLGLPTSTLFRLPKVPASTKAGFTLAQKMVGRACGLPEGQGVRPGTYCEPKMTTVGSQDTTGTMTRDELKDLACLGFSSDMVMQSFCHTAAYPKPVDVKMHHELPAFMSNRGGVSLKPGDGVIHSWLNRLLLPDTVGTGGDSHTRFPIGISFPAGSGLVAFGAATGVMPLDMPESILVRFKGKMQPGITLRDLVHAIPYYAIKAGLLTVAKSGKINEFSGRILEIEGLPDLKVEQAFELSDASAERSAAGCTVKLNPEPVKEYLNSNIVLMKNMIAQGYNDKRALERRIKAVEAWLANPNLLEADANAEYAHVLEIDMDQLKEPVMCCPNDPDDAKLLSEVAGTKIDEVFIGSCMTNIGHFRAASKLLEGRRDIPVKLRVAPPTKMDAAELTKEGHYGVFGAAGARTEMPGCSLCMGNQAQVREGATVVSTSTRNFPNRLGKNTNVYLGSAEVAAISSKLGRIPTVAEYQDSMTEINKDGSQIYKYMNFDKIEEYAEVAKGVAA
jgi:aconitate hydratase 2/2-methylisocitrate dehydratase